MKNIFLFIRQYFNFLSFLLFQVAALVLLSNASKTHQTVFAEATGEVTGEVNQRYNHLRSYFTLGETNRLLAEENSRLKNALRENFQAVNNQRINGIDTSIVDTLGRYRKYTYLPATVVGNSYALQNNYLMVERGAAQGARKGMAVVGSTGIVGVVVETSENFSKVMSLLHHNSKVSAMLKKDNSAGSIEWDGENPSYLIMKNVTKSAKINIGDSVVTSTYSANFPSSLLVGTIAGIIPDPSSNFYTLKVKTATNFYTIQFVNLVENTRFAERVALENSTKQ